MIKDTLRSDCGTNSESVIDHEERPIFCKKGWALRPIQADRSQPGVKPLAKFSLACIFLYAELVHQPLWAEEWNAFSSLGFVGIRCEVLRQGNSGAWSLSEILVLV
jgi:hypothetical protein